MVDFVALVSRHKTQLRAAFEPDVLQKICQQHKDLVRIAAQEAPLKSQLQAKTRSEFSKSWSPCGSRFHELRIFVAGLQKSKGHHNHVTPPALASITPISKRQLPADGLLRCPLCPEKKPFPHPYALRTPAAATHGNTFCCEFCKHAPFATSQSLAQYKSSKTMIKTSAFRTAFSHCACLLIHLS